MSDANLRLVVTALKAQSEDRALAVKQANEMCLSLMNSKLSPAELGEHVFKKLVEHMHAKELSRSQSYAGVIQATIFALDRAIQSTTDPQTKASLIEVVQSLHITVQV